MNETFIYLDYAAATPVDPRVSEAMNACLHSPTAFANPSALQHGPGRAAHAIVEQSRAQVARLIGAAPHEVVWTSGATEANNLAILGAAKFRRGQGRHIITAKTEHASVLAAVRHLESNGYSVTRVTPDARGVISADIIAAALRDDTTLVSIMHANNEIGVIQDIAAIGTLCREHGVLFHVDAAQSAGRLPIDVGAQSIDLLSLSAHKLYGPKGVGALYMNELRTRRVEPILFGGGHERGLRPGTTATHQVVGMGEAYDLAEREGSSDVAHIASLRDCLWAQVRNVPAIILNGENADRCCHILSVSVAGVEGESLMSGLQERGLAVSAGAACVTTGDEPSAVLRNLGRSDELAKSSVRFSFGRWTSTDEINMAAQIFRDVVGKLHKVATHGDGMRLAPGARNVFSGAAGNRERGIEVAFWVHVVGVAIGEMEYQAYGCPHTLAACGWLTEHLTGRPVAALREMAPETLMRAVDVPAQKRGRMLVVQDALRNCFAAWDNTEASQ